MRVKQNAMLVLMAVLIGSLILLLARLVVVFTESLEVVRADRASDEGLMHMCSGGEALASARLRTACMEARAEHASPILLKALSRMGDIIANEAVSIATAPMRCFTTASIVGLLGVLPWLPFALRFLFAPAMRVENDGYSHRVIVLQNGRNMEPLGGELRRRNTRQKWQPLTHAHLSDEGMSDDDLAQTV
jgi:hypothetical protein